MADLLKLLVPVFLSPTNYSEMLKKLAGFLFWEAWIVTFLLREIPAIDAWLRSAENFGAIGTALSVIPAHEKLNIGGLVVALAIAGASYAVTLHDRISDAFGIRRRFDRNHILLPLAVLVGAKLSPSRLNALVRDRHILMRKVFYKYVSSRADKPLVDKHEIERALAGWSWFWILVEAIPLVLLAAIIAAYFGAHSLLVGFLVASVGIWLAAWAYSFRLEKFVRPEIEAIAADPTAALAVTEAFNAL